MGVPPMIDGRRGRRGRGSRDLRHPLRRGSRAHGSGRGHERRRPRLGHRAQVRQARRRHDDCSRASRSPWSVSASRPSPRPTRRRGARWRRRSGCWSRTLPPMLRSSIDTADLATTMVVYPTDGHGRRGAGHEDRGAGAGRGHDDWQGLRPQIGSATSLLNSILVGIALITLIIGGLSVINTMAMSIAERTREIGVKRAIGGARSRIVRELVVESALIGFIGGVTGAGPGGHRRDLRERGRQVVRHDPVRPDTPDRAHRGRVRHDPRSARGLRARAPRRAPRPGHGPALRMTTMRAGGPTMPLLEGTNLRKTYRLSKRNPSRRCGASTSPSTPARWSRSWARRARARAP